MTARHNPSEPPVVLDVRVVAGSGGGPDKTILNSPRFLAPAGYRMLCAYMHPPGDPGFEQLRQKAERWHAPLLSVPDRGPLDLSVFSQLLTICRREHVAIWHGHDYKSNLLGLLLRPFHRMQLVTTVHGWVERTWKTPFYFALDRLCLPFYQLVISVSEDLQAQSLKAGVRPSRCVLIENGIDIEEFSRRRSVVEAKRELGFSPDRLLIGAVGRLSPEKGFDLLIRSTDQLLKRGLNVELAIAGEGTQKDELQALIDSLGQRDRFRLVGYCADPRTLYEAFDVYALSSVREGLPNVLLEAMALQVPVVATRIAGVPRLISHEENGLLVEPGSEAELTEALSRLLSNASLRQHLSQEGRHTIETRYSFAVRMRKIADFYDTLLHREAS